MTCSVSADGIRRRAILAMAMAAPVIAGSFHPSASLAQAEADPLPSWNDGKAKRSIIDFVGRVMKQGSPDFVPPAERIAVFDNDGTLWPENPLPFQLAYALYTLKQMTAGNPALNKEPMVQAALKGDIAALLAGPHHDGLMRIVALTHAGMTTEEFKSRVKAGSPTPAIPGSTSRTISSPMSRCRRSCVT